MKYQSGSLGRVFWATLDHGEDLRGGLLDLVRRENINQAVVLLLGALESGRMVLGPVRPEVPPEPAWFDFADGREIVGLGSLARGDDGPTLHLHLSAGRSDDVRTGCLREDSRVFLVVEAVILEISGPVLRRVFDRDAGVELLSLVES